jgi:hypothetical protein
MSGATLIADDDDGNLTASVPRRGIRHRDGAVGPAEQLDYALGESARAGREDCPARNREITKSLKIVLENRRRPRKLAVFRTKKALEKTP